MKVSKLLTLIQPL